MGSNGSFAQHQGVGDLVIRKPARDQRGDLALALGQPIVGRFCRAARCGGQRARDLHGGGAKKCYTQIAIRHSDRQICDDRARGGECCVGPFAMPLGLVEPTKAGLDAPTHRG